MSKTVAFALPTPNARSTRPARPSASLSEVIGTMASFLGIAAATWGVVMAIAPGLQIRRMIIRRSSADLSLGYFGVLLPGFLLWIGYGWTTADWPLVIPNAIALRSALSPWSWVCYCGAGNTSGIKSNLTADALDPRTHPSARVTTMLRVTKSIPVESLRRPHAVSASAGSTARPTRTRPTPTIYPRKTPS